MHQSFSFPLRHTDGGASALKPITTRSLKAFDAVGAPGSWVLSNHDVPPRDPARRTNGERLGRDGCRVPLPRNDSTRSLGFSDADTGWPPARGPGFGNPGCWCR